MAKTTKYKLLDVLMLQKNLISQVVVISEVRPIKQM